MALGSHGLPTRFEDEGCMSSRNELPGAWSLWFGPREPHTERWLVLGSLSASQGCIRHTCLLYVGLFLECGPGDWVALRTKPPLASLLASGFRDGISSRDLLPGAPLLVYRCWPKGDSSSAGPCRLGQTSSVFHVLESQLSTHLTSSLC